MFPQLTSLHAQNSLIYIVYELLDRDKIRELEQQIRARHEKWIILRSAGWDTCHLRLILDPNHNFAFSDGVTRVVDPRGEDFDEDIYHITDKVVSEFVCK
jgi:hypothetical protein